MSLPLHNCVLDELGRKKTVSGDIRHFALLKENGNRDLFLGLGPNPEKTLALAANSTACYLECPDFISQMDKEWIRNIPPGFGKIAPRRLSSHLDCRIWLYRPGLRLFPSFWADILASLKFPPKAAAQSGKNNLVILSSAKDGLLTLETEHALKQEGMRVLHLPRKKTAQDLADILKSKRPRHFLSINFHGLDSYGENIALLKKSGTRASVWCVDNPAHLLSALKTRMWTGLNLFVTDHWFVKPLRELGARNVFHLPLAVCPEIFNPAAQKPDMSFEFLFVGRSAFPDQKKFFSGQKIDPRLEHEAQDLLACGTRPDFSWWQKKMHLPLWPGNRIRTAGFGAEKFSKIWRREILQAVSEKYNLTIVGDQDWSHLVPRADLRPPVDYYSKLPQIYARSRYSLNITGMLLPRGLTQRHFDVWMAGGFLLTDYTRGLDIFPRKLVREHSFSSAENLLRTVRRLENDPALKADLMRGYQQEIITFHTYRHRVRSILENARD
ncbi:MAG: glycosyltransferase family protein [Thermodesulfobacteriota bacterium]